MSLLNQVRETFAEGGLLSRTVNEFTPREGQTQMATAIARTIDSGGVLVVEAGTGIGKTFAYLVPALLSGARVLLSTATKTLQDQLYGRDLPLLIEVLGVPVRTALLKGRSSYLCQHRLGLARHDSDFRERGSLHALAKVEAWALRTRTGDLAEMPGLDERSPVIPWVSSSRENCLGTQCPQLRACHVNQARREALMADVVVVNHHLFFADLAVRESGMAELLPTVQTVIFDEAHQLNETGVQFLGQQLTTGQLLDYSRDVLVGGIQYARGLEDWQQIAADIEYAARGLRMVVGRSYPGARLRWVDSAPDQVNATEWSEAMESLRQSCSRAAASLEKVEEIAPDLARLAERCHTHLQALQSFSKPCGEGSVRWLDVGAQLRLVESPLDIAQAVQSRLLAPMAEDGSRRSWIFTSATLGDDSELKWFTEPCGLENAEVLRVDSPFDYANQSSLYVPPDFPKPSDSAHSEKVADLVAGAAPAIGGRTLVLTTTLRALKAISDALKRHFNGPLDLEVLVQGEQPKRELLERFRQGCLDGGRGCILVASASFWEGVDIAGDALQLLVIDKLPFPPPSDPLVEARSKRLESMGRSVFKDYFMAEAAIALKQGAGRLIRRESDRGILVVCDVRLARMGYGRRLLAALPPMLKIESENEWIEALSSLTRISTTAQTLI